MKILSASQTKELDNFTIQNEPISSLNLMERASSAFSSWFYHQFDSEEGRGKPIYIFAGVGNNGGDGLAIARMLSTIFHYKVKAFIVTFSDKLTPDFVSNRQRLPIDLNVIHSTDSFPKIPENAIVIDAVFGSGLSRPIEGWLATLVSHLNKSKSESNTKIVSVDIASGLFSDSNSESDAIIQPDFTVSFQLPKLAFLLPQNEKFVGEWNLVDIGQSEKGIEKAASDYEYIDRKLAKLLLKTRTKFSHKGTYGHLLIFAGSYGKIGAAVLCGKSALRTGAGLVSIHLPKSGYEIMQISAPEIMCSIDSDEEVISKLPDLSQFKIFAIGPGIGKSEKTIELLSNLLDSVESPIVFDADALNLLSENQELLGKIPKNSILTPHPKEFERLAGKWENDFERLGRQVEFSQKYNCFLVLKGAHTSVSTPKGKVFFNSTGNSGMATAGSGDVLTGMIASLLAQNYSPQNASILGVYLHGLAGDLAVLETGKPSLIASDLIENVGKAFISIENEE